MKLCKMIILAILLCITLSHPCSMFTKSDGDLTLVGNNEDWSDPNSKLKVEVGDDKTYSCIFTGFEFGPNIFVPQGGVNEKGLVWDGMATPYMEIKNRVDKSKFNGNIIYETMKRCGTVKEAISFLNNYDISFLGTAQLMYVDKEGNSAIIEGDEIIFLDKSKGYQIATNFYLSQIEDKEEIDCRRYKIADKMLNSNHLSINTFRKILSAVHQEGDWGGTQYSQIYDLKNMDIYLYHYHDFENPLILDFNETIAKGDQYLSIPSLFPEKFSFLNLLRLKKEEEDKKLINIITKTIENEGIEKAVETFEKLIEKQEVTNEYTVNEDELNDLGYKLLGEKKFNESIEIFKLNVKLHPESWNCYDSLGEAYMLSGDKSNGIRNYERSLELNPENHGGKKNIEKMSR